MLELPQPEHPVDETVVEEENRVQPSSLILALQHVSLPTFVSRSSQTHHVSVRTLWYSYVGFVIWWGREATHRQVDIVVW